MPNDLNKEFDTYASAPNLHDEFDKYAQDAAPTGPQDPQISELEAVLRGAGTGALTKAVNIPVAALEAGAQKLGGDNAGLSELYQKALQEQNKRESLSAEQHPGYYYPGMVGGAVVSPVGKALKGIGLIGEAAQGAPVLQRIAQAGKAGMAIGGAYGAGQAAAEFDPNKDIGQEAKKAIGTTAGQVAGGAILGGGLHAAGEGIMSAVGSAAEKEIPLLSNAARRFQLGKEGVNLYNDAQLAERTAEKFKALGQEGIASEIDKVTDGMNDVLNAAKQKGQTVNYEDVLLKAQELRAKAEAMEPGEIQDELLDLTGRVKDSVNQFKTKVPVTTLTKTGEREIPGEPAIESKASSLEELEQQAAKLNQDAKLNAKATNQPAPTYKVKSEVEGDKTYQRIYEYSPATAEQGESVKPVGKSWIEASEGQEYKPGSPPETQSIYEPKTEQVPSPELEPESAKQARTLFGRDRSFDTSQAREESQKIYDAMSEALYKGVPEYQPYSDKYKLFISAMEDLGLDVKTPSDFFVKTAEEMANGTPGKGGMFNPNITKQLKATFRQAAQDPTMAEKLDLGLDKLKHAGFQGIDTLRANAEQALRDEHLSYGLVNPKSLLSPIGGMWYKGVKAASVAPNALGLAANKLEGMAGAPITQAAGQFLAKTPAAGAVGSVAKDFLGNEIDDKPGNFYKHIVAADDNTLQQIGASLHGTPYAYQGDALVQAIKLGDQQRKNTMIFSIANNPKIEDIIRGRAAVK